MEKQKEFSNLENANAILNGMEDCIDDFVESFVELHQKPIDNHYMYEWLFRSLIDVIKINHSVLYVACGTAGYTRLFKNIKRFVGIDFSKKMIAAARKLSENKNIDFDFQCTTFEAFDTQELFDLVYLGPYGNNVPYTLEVFEKAKKMIKEDGMIVCAGPVPELKGFYCRAKEFLKQFFIYKTFDYDPIKKLEKMLKKSKLEIYVKLSMKTDIGYSYCYITQKKNA